MEPVPRWRPAEEAQLRAQYPHMSTRVIAAMLDMPIGRVHAKANKLGLFKSTEYLASPAACRLRRGDQVGKPHRFPKGHVPANKGLRRPGWFAGRMKETQFRKGQVNGQAAIILMPIGSTRLVDGYVYIKVAAVQNVPYTVNWKPLHVLEWERVNGPVPKAHALRFINGDREDIRLENIECVSRAELMRRNTIHNMPKPLKDVIHLRGALERQIRRKERNEQQR